MIHSKFDMKTYFHPTTTSTYVLYRHLYPMTVIKSDSCLTPSPQYCSNSCLVLLHINGIPVFLCTIPYISIHLSKSHKSMNLSYNPRTCMFTENPYNSPTNSLVHAVALKQHEATLRI